MVGGEGHDDLSVGPEVWRRSPGDTDNWWWNDKVQEVIKAKEQAMKKWETAGRQR